MARQAYAVEFENTFEDITDRKNLRIRDGDFKVLLEEAADFHAKHGGWVCKVWFRNDDGSEFWSWGKSWVREVPGAPDQIVRIGAGASGDLTVWNRKGCYL